MQERTRPAAPLSLRCENEHEMQDTIAETPILWISRRSPEASALPADWLIS